MESNAELFKRYIEVASEEDINKILNELFMKRKGKDSFVCGLNEYADADCDDFRTCEDCLRNSINHAIAERKLIMYLESQED